jgi:hypothetical protein
MSARDEFASTGYVGPWTPQMFIKGWLFYRHGETPPKPSSSIHRMDAVGG